MSATSRIVPVLLVALTLAATPAVTAETWSVDKAHTEINFKVDHFFTPVSGTFTDFDIDLQYDAANPANSSVDVRIEVASLHTGNADRDQHLRSPDFFEADRHPHITFRSISVRQAGEGQLVATGPLTIKGVSRIIDLPIQVLGVQEIREDMRPMLGGISRVAGFAADTRILRQDFGVGVGNWAATLVVGGNVDITIAVEANQM